VNTEFEEATALEAVTRRQTVKISSVIVNYRVSELTSGLYIYSYIL
jgi:hypothetical protein